MNESVLREYTTSSMQSTISFNFLLAILYNKWTKQVNPAVWKWWFLTHSLLGQICHFLLLKPSSQLLAHDTLWDNTSDQRVTSCHPKTWGPYLVHCDASTRITCSWHQRTANSAILQDFGNNNGCCISLATADLLILPPTLNIPSSSMNGSNFSMLLHDFKHFLFPKDMNSSPKCLL